MNIKVYYVSPKGCAEAIADAIAREVKCTKEALMPAYPPENVQMMFIGCEGSKADKVTMEFLNSLNTNRVRNAALYSCNAKRDNAAIEQMREVLTARGINVLKGSVAFPGKSLFGGKRPGAEDLENARNYAKECIEAILKK
ncbi:MAG: hypothetical protein IKJ65_10485 [Clostridia bacterium]|nr:hypothetical protein [Clostridia bacterium]